MRQDLPGMPGRCGPVAFLLGAALVLVACGGQTPRPGATDTPRQPQATAADRGGSEATATPPPVASTPPARDRRDDATELARAWIDALAATETETAWALTSPRQRDVFGDLETFAAMRTDLAEGWGAWSAATGLQVTAVPIAAADPSAGYAVTLSGTVNLEGSEQQRATALGVLVDEDEGVVLGQPTITWDTDEGAGATSVTATVPQEADQRLLAVDGRVVPSATPGPGAGETLQLTTEVSTAGPHTVTAAYTTGDGLIHADALRVP